MPATDSRLTRRQQLLLATVALLALALRLLYLWGQARNNPLYDALFMDPLQHHEWAQQIAAGKGMGEAPFFRAPLYYYCLGALYALFSVDTSLGRLFGCALGALAAYLAGRLGNELGGFRTGLLAALLTACYWPLIYFDAELLSVSLENALNLGMLVALLAAGRRDDLRLYALGGLLFGLSAITRPTVLVLAPALAIWPAISMQPARRWRRALGAAALIGLGATAAILPVTARNALVGGEPVLIATSGGVNFYIGNNPSSNGYSALVPGAPPNIQGVYEESHRMAERASARSLSRGESSRFWLERSFDWIRTEPAAFAAHLGLKLRYLLAPVEIPNNQPIRFTTRFSALSALFWLGFPLLICLAAPGLVIGVAEDWRRWLLPLAFVLLLSSVIVLFFAPARFRAPLVPVLCVAAATCMWRLPLLFAARRLRRIAAAAAAAGAVALPLLTFPVDLGEWREAEVAGGLYRIGVDAFLPRSGREADLELAAAMLLEALERRPPRLPRQGRGAAAQDRRQPAGGGATRAGHPPARTGAGAGPPPGALLRRAGRGLLRSRGSAARRRDRRAGPRGRAGKSTARALRTHPAPPRRLSRARRRASRERDSSGVDRRLASQRGATQPAARAGAAARRRAPRAGCSCSPDPHPRSFP